ncbi:MAG TPA: hypothetical protein DCZ75_18300 [Geobacter sp.]|nr:hypothetical protein [Geobacter sp.]
MHTALQLAILMLVALAFNIPMGYLRETCRKFSPGWWFYVHISIPIIIYLRIKVGLGVQFIPFTLASAVCGQVIGGRIYKKRNSIG